MHYWVCREGPWSRKSRPRERSAGTMRDGSADDLRRVVDDPRGLDRSGDLVKPTEGADDDCVERGFGFR